MEEGRKKKKKKEKVYTKGRRLMLQREIKFNCHGYTNIIPHVENLQTSHAPLELMDMVVKFQHLED